LKNNDYGYFKISLSLSFISGSNLKISLIFSSNSSPGHQNDYAGRCHDPTCSLVHGATLHGSAWNIIISTSSAKNEARPGNPVRA